MVVEMMNFTVRFLFANLRLQRVAALHTLSSVEFFRTEDGKSVSATAINGFQYRTTSGSQHEFRILASTYTNRNTGNSLKEKEDQKNQNRAR